MVKLLHIILAISAAFASSGDTSSAFIACVRRCELSRCPSPVDSLSLWLTGWNCIDDCRYTCIHQITDQAIREGTHVQQYYGKWPFWRLWGMQEPASVAFSLLNLAAHIQGARMISRRVPNGHPVKPFYVRFALINACAWVFSALFHTRDTPITEKLDYFAAAMSIIYALYVTVVRLFHLYTPIPPSHSHSPASTNIKLVLWSAACLFVYLGHVLYLSLLPRFDYTYNMAFNVAVGLTHNLLWFQYALQKPIFPGLRRFPARASSYRPAYAYRPAVLVATTTAALALELYDFPPWFRVLDAHALWHLTTAPISVSWYHFLVLDALDDGWRGEREHRAN